MRCLGPSLADTSFESEENDGDCSSESEAKDHSTSNEKFDANISIRALDTTIADTKVNIALVNAQIVLL